MLAAASQKLIRRHDRIRAVWQRTPSLNTARRCELRLSALAAEARAECTAALTTTLPLPAQNLGTSATANAAPAVAHPGDVDAERGDASGECAGGGLLAEFAARLNRGERLNNTDRLLRQGLLFNHSGRSSP